MELKKARCCLNCGFSSGGMEDMMIAKILTSLICEYEAPPPSRCKCCGRDLENEQEIKQWRKEHTVPFDGVCEIWKPKKGWNE